MHQFYEVQAAEQGNTLLVAEYCMHVRILSGFCLSGALWGVQKCSLHRQALSISVCMLARVMSCDWT